MLHAAMHDG